MTVAALDRVIAWAVQQDADAVVFAVGRRPCVYLKGHVLPIAHCARPISTADVRSVCDMVLPPTERAHLTSGRVRARIDYGDEARFVVIAERLPHDERVSFWRSAG